MCTIKAPRQMIIDNLMGVRSTCRIIESTSIVSRYLTNNANTSIRPFNLKRNTLSATVAHGLPQTHPSRSLFQLAPYTDPSLA